MSWNGGGDFVLNISRKLVNLAFNINRHVFCEEKIDIPSDIPVIILCHQYKARPAYTPVQSDQAIYCCFNSHLDIPIFDKRQLQKIEVGQVHWRNSAG